MYAVFCLFYKQILSASQISDFFFKFNIFYALILSFVGDFTLTRNNIKLIYTWDAILIVQADFCESNLMLSMLQSSPYLSVLYVGFVPTYIL